MRRAAMCQRAYRFKSPFKMNDSAISFIDLRRCWLSRLSFGELDSHEFFSGPELRCRGDQAAPDAVLRAVGMLGSVSREVKQ